MIPSYTKLFSMCTTRFRLCHRIEKYDWLILIYINVRICVLIPETLLWTQWFSYEYQQLAGVQEEKDHVPYIGNYLQKKSFVNYLLFPRS